MENNFYSRKRIHLKNYDYSSEGVYFVTISVHNRQNLLSKVVGRGLAPAEVEYTAYGKEAERQLLLLEERYPFLRIEAYVIMPDHIHMMLAFGEKTWVFQNPYLHLTRARVSGGHLCKAEAPTEAAAETVDFAKQKTEGEIARAFTTPQSCLRQASSPDKWSYALFSF